MKYTNKKRQAVQEFEITQADAENLFAECNRLFFNNDLSEIPIAITNSQTMNGDFKYDVDFESKKLTNFRIEISNNRLRTKSKYMATMIHEMLHYQIIANITPDTINEAIWYYYENNNDKFNELLYNDKFAHTGEWLEKAETINKLYGIKINRS